MLATYKIVKSVNVPDQVGVNDNGKVLMLSAEQNEYARPGSILVFYRGELRDKYDMEVIIHINDLDDFTVVVRDAIDDETGFEDDECYDDIEEYFYSEHVDDSDIVNVLGQAFAAVEKKLNKIEKKEVINDKKRNCCRKVESLQDLKKLLDSLFEDDE